MHRPGLILLLSFCGFCGCRTTPPTETSAGPTADLTRWAVEQMPGGTVTVEGDALVIKDTAGVTVWLKERITAPAVISYDVKVVAENGPYDRVSDVNCFWMANDPSSPDNSPFAPGHGRTGKLEDYDSLRLYYVGMGGNYNSTTRFRHYEGNGVKPLLPENDLTDKKFLLEPNQTYRIRIVVAAGRTEYWRDEERFFSFTDAAQPKTGWFGFRTVKSHLEFRHFRITRSE